MKCERCGKELTNRIINIGGVTVCENCARLMGYDGFLKDPSDLLGNPFAPLDEIAASLMRMSELDFGNSTLTCPKCGMTLREFENSGKVGCIECYNTFKDYIVREMFKQQGNSEYAGRLPARSADTGAQSDDITETKKASGSDKAKKAEPENEPVRTPETMDEKPETKKEEKSGLTVDKLKKADLGMLSDEDLEKGIKIAAEAEEYMLASKLRDELKGRKGGSNNG